MMHLLVLSVLALAALGAPGPQPASPICLGLTQASSHLPLRDDVWLDSLHGPPDTLYTDSLLVLWGGAMLHSSQESVRVEVHLKIWSGTWSTEISRHTLGPGDSVPLDWALGVGDSSQCFFVRESIIDSTPTESSFVTWRFWVLRQPSGVVFLDTTAPCDTIDTITDLYFTIGLRNYGGDYDSGRLCCVMSDTARVVYAESMSIGLEPGINNYCQFYVPRFTTTGPHHGIIHFWTYGGSADTLEWDFWVGPPPGIQEDDAMQLAEHKPPATMLRTLPPGAVAFDAMGRRATSRKPGIYFVRTAPTALPRKVLLVE